MTATHATRRATTSLTTTIATVFALTAATLVATAGPAFAASSVITSSGPLDEIEITDDLNCRVEHVDDDASEFFGGTACATLVATGGTLYGPANIPAGSAPATRTAFTPVSQSGVTGSGTSADPYRVVTVVDLGTSGVRLTQTDSYVVGQESYRTDVAVQNTTGAAVEAIVYRAGDCFLQDSDDGFGSVSAQGAVACVAADPAGGPGDRIQQWFPLTAGSNHYEARYWEVWQWIATQEAFPDTCRCGELVDNGAGLSWTRDLAAGATSTVSHLTTFSPLGVEPLTTAKTAADDTTPAGGDNGYTITVSNPNPADVTLDSIVDTLPDGFAYRSGTTTGATTSDPAVDGQELTWAGAFTVPGDGALSLTFGVTVSDTPGTYHNQAWATSTIAVVGTGETAPVVVSESAGTDDECVDLLAGQSIDAGDVCVTQSDGTVTVTYTTVDGWELSQTHLHAAEDASGVPQTRARRGQAHGNPIPGRFDHAASHDPGVTTTAYTFDRPVDDGTWVLAAHADVVQADQGRRAEGAWADGERFVPDRGSWAMYVTIGDQA